MQVQYLTKKNKIYGIRLYMLFLWKQFFQREAYFEKNRRNSLRLYQPSNLQHRTVPVVSVIEKLQLINEKCFEEKVK